jgi:hypothetical protein
VRPISGRPTADCSSEAVRSPAVNAASRRGPPRASRPRQSIHVKFLPACVGCEVCAVQGAHAMRSSPDPRIAERHARKAARIAGLITRKLSRDKFMLIQPENNTVVTQEGPTGCGNCNLLRAKEDLHLPAAGGHALGFRRRKRVEPAPVKQGPAMCPGNARARGAPSAIRRYRYRRFSGRRS